MRKLIAPAIGAIATVVMFTAPSADAKGSKWTDIRVVSHTGETLAEHRQFTEWATVKTSVEADCFGPSNPSTGETHKVKEPTVLGALIDAAKVDDDLDPLLITDGFVDDGFGFGVCDIGGLETSGFSYWYSAVNGIGSTTGPDLIPVKNGDSNLWYLTTGDEPGFPSELVLDAPARVEANEPFEVTVTRVLADGTEEPAVGVTVSDPPVATDAEGKATFTVGPGQATLRATGEPDDVTSAATVVCAAVNVTDCPEAPGMDIYGSKADDKIKSTPGNDYIVCGRGKDIVKKAQDADEIDSSCEKVKK